MTLHEQARSLKTDEIVALLREHSQMQQRNAQLAAQLEALTASHDELMNQLDWLKRQLFGTKSERRIVGGPDTQLFLGQDQEEAAAAFSPTASEVTVTVPSHKRHKRNRGEGWASEQGLRFGPDVPVEEVHLDPPETEGLSENDYELVAVRSTHRLAQRQGSYFVIRYLHKVVRLKESREIVAASAPAAIFDRSFADVSLLAGLCVEKFLYHMPLHRQHQRLKQCGIEIDRSTLTHLVHRTAELLQPIVEALRRSILQSEVLLADETSLKAGRIPGKGRRRGKMKQGWLWPLHGDQDEVVFHFNSSRKAAVVYELLENWEGTLVSDGYQGYTPFVRASGKVVHAQCWAHARRKFEQAESAEPDLCTPVLDRIAELYRHEKMIREQELVGEAKLRYRQQHCEPIVIGIFQLLRELLDDQTRRLLPSSPFTKAARYALDREEALKVFLGDPAVPPDTNALEQKIRPIALGRNNWVFCSSEAGAEVVAALQSLLQTCRLQGVDPYTYLVDVLQRVQVHPAREVALLTPRLWKEHFADRPMRSVADQRA